MSARYKSTYCNTYQSRVNHVATSCPRVIDSSVDATKGAHPHPHSHHLAIPVRETSTLQHSSWYVCPSRRLNHGYKNCWQISTMCGQISTLGHKSNPSTTGLKLHPIHQCLHDTISPEAPCVATFAHSSTSFLRHWTSCHEVFEVIDVSDICHTNEAMGGRETKPVPHGPKRGRYRRSCRDSLSFDNDTEVKPWHSAASSCLKSRRRSATEIHRRNRGSSTNNPPFEGFIRQRTGNETTQMIRLTAMFTTKHGTVDGHRCHWDYFHPCPTVLALGLHALDHEIVQEHPADLPRSRITSCSSCAIRSSEERLVDCTQQCGTQEQARGTAVCSRQKRAVMR